MARAEAAVKACNHLYLWDARLLYASHGYVSRAHSHFAATLILAWRGRIRVAVGGGRSRSCAAVLIGPNRRFAIHAPQAEVLIFNQDPDAAGYTPLAACLGGQGHRLLAPVLFAPLRDELAAAMHGHLDCDQAQALFETVLALLAPRLQMEPELDPRVRHVAGTLRERRPSTVRVAQLAEAVDTSTDRLMRLFGAQLGLPIRRFLLWLKLRSAISLLQRGHSLTHIAQDAGFYDSAHLVHTVTGMYGVQLSSFNDPRFVQVHHCAQGQSVCATRPTQNA